MNRGTLARLTIWAAPFAAVLLVPTQIWALDQLSGGVSLGGFQVGTVPRLAVRPHVAASWLTKSDFVVALHDQCSFLPPTDADRKALQDITRNRRAIGSARVVYDRRRVLRETTQERLFLDDEVEERVDRL